MTDNDYLQKRIREENHRDAEKSIEKIDYQALADRWEDLGHITSEQKPAFIEAARRMGSLDGLCIEFPRAIRNRVLANLSAEQREDLQDIPVGMAVDYSYNGMAESNLNGDVIILLNAGIVTSFQTAMFAFLAFSTLGTSHPWSTAFGEFELTNTFFRLARSLTDRRGTLWLQGIKTKHYKDRPRPQAGVELYTQYAEDFVLLHEYGHVLLGHIDEYGSRKFEKLSPEEQLAKLRDWEFEADRFAVEEQIRAARNVGERSAIATSVGVTLRLFELGDCADPDPLPKDENDHPSGEERWRNVKVLFNSKEELAMIELVDTTFDKLKRSICPPKPSGDAV